MIGVNICLSFQTLGLFYFQSNNDSGGGMVCCVGPAVLILGLMLGVYVWQSSLKRKELLRNQTETANMSPAEKERYYENKEKEKQRAAKIAAFGHTSPEMICPHCQTKGQVRTTKITQKKGISGGKATGAVLTGGLSLLATGLSREEVATQAHCDKCGNTWHF